MDDENRRLKSIKLCDICGSRWSNLESTDCINCFPQSKLNYFQKFKRLFGRAGNLITTSIIILILAFCFFYFSYFNEHDDSNLYHTRTIDIESTKQVIKTTDVTKIPDVKTTPNEKMIINNSEIISNENLFEFNLEKVNGHLSLTYKEFENDILILNVEKQTNEYFIYRYLLIYYTPKKSISINNINADEKFWGYEEIGWYEKDIEIEIDFTYREFPEGDYTIQFLGIEKDYLDSKEFNAKLNDNKKESIDKLYKILLEIDFSNYN